MSVTRRAAAFGDDSSAGYKFDSAIVNRVTTQVAAQVIAPIAVASPSAGSRFLLTFWVDDVDAACAELASHGVELINGPLDRPWGLVPGRSAPTLVKAGDMAS